MYAGLLFVLDKLVYTCHSVFKCVCVCVRACVFVCICVVRACVRARLCLYLCCVCVCARVCVCITYFLPICCITPDIRDPSLVSQTHSH